MNALAGLLVGAIFFLPIYLPFVLSFRIKSEDFREVRIALRLGSILALVGALIAMGSRKDYGDDVAGNLAGAVHNLFGCGVLDCFLWLPLYSLVQACAGSASRERVRFSHLRFNEQNFQQVAAANAGSPSHGVSSTSGPAWLRFSLGLSVTARMTSNSKRFVFACLGALLVGLLVVLFFVPSGNPRYRSESLVLVRPYTKSILSQSFQSHVIQSIPGVFRLWVTPTFSGVPTPGIPVVTNGMAIHIFAGAPTAEGAQRAADDAAQRVCRLLLDDYALTGEIGARANAAQRFSFFHDKLRL